MSRARPRLLVRDESPGRSPAWLEFRHPSRVFRTRRPDDVAALLAEAQEAVTAGRWIAGFLAYEAAAGLDPALETFPPGPLPLLWLGVFDPPRRLAELPSPAGRCRLSTWRPSITPAQHRAAIEAIHRSIAAGDTYQVNFTLRLASRLAGDPFALFHRLWRGQGGPLSAFLDLGRHVLCSASPELLLDKDGERLTSRPMKGTAPRGPDAAGDRRLARRLAESGKERAENLMIVDMVRNDLGRIARPGSVRVRDLFQVERYDSVHQLVSTVEALSDAGLADLIGALFPAASITGAPRVSTMRRIRQLEEGPRGAYCGSIGFAAPDGRARFSVAIRTVWIDRSTGRAEYGSGGGIVWDSRPEREYRECLLKARLVTAAAPRFRLFETLLWWGPGQGFALLERHLGRLAASARYFSFPDPGEEPRRRLASWARGRDPAPRRVRLLFDRRGRVVVEDAGISRGPASEVDRDAWRIAVDDHRVDPDDRFLRHKTTWRRVYEVARRRWPEHDDVLLVNRDEELTESTVANLVLDLDGTLATPRSEAGLLPGTLRAELIERGSITEARLGMPELRRARAAWLVNSVRGWIPAEVPEVGLAATPPPTLDPPLETWTAAGRR